MATPKNVKIFQIQDDDLSNLLAGQIGVSNIEEWDNYENVIPGLKLWGGKDKDGKLSKWLQLDEYARVNSLEFSEDGSIFIGYDVTPISVPSNDSVVIGSNAGSKVTQVDSVVVGYGAGEKSKSFHETVCIGAYAGINNGGTGNVVIGYQANCGTSGISVENSRNVSVGEYAGVGTNNRVGCISVGPESGSGVTGFNSVLNNMISIGDGAGKNVYATSGSCPIFIGKKAGYGQNADSCIMMGNGAGYFPDGLPWNYSKLFATNNVHTDMVSSQYINKFIVHQTLHYPKGSSITENNFNTLPGMTIELGSGDQKLTTDPDVLLPNPSRFYGPMVNMYGNYAAATCFVVLSAVTPTSNIFAVRYTSIEKIPYISNNTGDNVHYSNYRYAGLGDVDLSVFRNILVSASDEIFSNSRSFTLKCATREGIESTITLVGDTRSSQDEGTSGFGQFNLSFPATSFSDYSGITTAIKCVYTGDNLYGYDRKARKIKITTIDAPTGSTEASMFMIVDVAQTPQFMRRDGYYYPNTLPNRFTLGEEFSYIYPTAIVTSSVSVYAWEQDHSLPTTLTVTTDYTVVNNSNGSATITIKNKVYDNYTVSFNSLKNIWFVANSRYK